MYATDAAVRYDQAPDSEVAMTQSAQQHDADAADKVEPEAKAWLRQRGRGGARGRSGPGGGRSGRGGGFHGGGGGGGGGFRPAYGGGRSDDFGRGKSHGFDPQRRGGGGWGGEA